MKKLIIIYIVLTGVSINAQEKILLKGLTRKEIKELKKKKKRAGTY